MVERVKPSLSSGEISPSLWSRVDLERYQTALRRAENVIVMPYGGVVGRPGLGYVHKTKYPDQAVILVRFIHSREQAYVIEFGPGYALFTANDARVRSASANDVVSAVAGAGVYVVDTVAAHALSVGSVVTIETVIGTGAMAGINDTHTVSEIVSATSFKVPRYTTATGAYVAGGLVYTCTQVVTPYEVQHLSALRFTQSVDVLSIFHEDLPIQEIRRTSVTSFSIVTPVFDDGPFLDENADDTIKVSVSSSVGNIEIKASADIFNANHVGALFKIKEKNIQRTSPWEPNKIFGGRAFGSFRRSDGKTYECVTNTYVNTIATGTVAPTHDVGIIADGDGNYVSGLANFVGVEWLYLHSGFGVARITGVISPTEAQATVLLNMPHSVVGSNSAQAGPWTMIGNGVDVTLDIPGASSHSTSGYDVRINDGVLSPSQYSVNGTQGTFFIVGVPPTVMTFDTPPSNLSTVTVFQGASEQLTDLWAFGAWSEDQGYPSVGIYHGDRFVAASTRVEPERFDMSRVGVYKDFGVSVPVQDDDAISFTVNSREVSDIRDLISLEQLIAMTGIAAVKIGAGVDDALTPSNTSVRTQAFRGSAYVQAQSIGDGAVFAQRNGTKLRDLSYQYEGAKFTGQELSLLVRHLFGGTRQIVDMAYADEPDNVLWVVVSSGALYSLTYIKEQDVVGWTRHPMTGFVERVCVVPDGVRDVLYVVVRRAVNGMVTRYVEKLTNTDYDDRVDAVCVDSSLTYDGRGNGVQTATLTATAWFAGDTGSVALSFASAEDALLVPSDIGEQIWIYLGDDIYRGTIDSLPNSQLAIVRHNTDVPAAMQGAPTLTWAIARTKLSRLDHLVGETVAVCADGEDAGTQVVQSDGTIIIEAHGAVVHIGLPYTPLIETLDIDSALLDRKKITELAVYVQDTNGLQVSGQDGVFTDFRTRSIDDDYGAAAPQTGIVFVEIQSGFTDGGRITVRQSAPLPIKVLSIIPNIVKGTS
jgi:hypothetical protein